MEVKRNIFHLIDHMGLGGAQRIIQGLSVSGYGTVIYALKNKGKMIGQIPKKIPVIYGDKSKFGMYFSLFDIHQKINEFDINYIHCHLPFSVLLGFVLSYLNPSLKFVFHDHGDLANGNRIRKIILSIVANRGIVIVNSLNQKRLIQKIRPDIDVVLINNFVNHEEFYKDKRAGEIFRKIFNIPDNRICIGFASRLVSSKGWKDILIAFNNLSQSNIKLIIAGVGNDFHQIEKFIQEHNILNTVLVGQIIEMRNFYNALDIFVMPTKKEAFGLSHIESQACGVPIIVYNTKGINETIDQSNSILVDVGSIKEMQKSIERLLINHEQMEMLSEAGILNAKKFTAIAYIKKLIKNT
jgi:glycosyltransferase involved in cell wall biosynthesis